MPEVVGSLRIDPYQDLVNIQHLSQEHLRPGEANSLDFLWISGRTGEGIEGGCVFHEVNISRTWKRSRDIFLRGFR